MKKEEVEILYRSREEKRKMFNLTALCAGSFKYYIVDIVVILFFVFCMVKSARKGFFNSVFGVISTLAAVILAIMGAKILLGVTGGLFGFQDSVFEKFREIFSKWEGFNTDISGIGVDEALKTNTMPAIVAKLILKIAGKDSEIVPGTTLAQLTAEATSSLASLLFAGILIFFVTKLVFLILKRTLSGDPDDLEESGALSLNSLLGALLGAVYALVIVSGILAILAVFPFKSVTGYLSNTLIVGKLYVSNPLVYILGLFL